MRVPFSDRTEISKFYPDSALSLPQLTDIIAVAIIAFKHATEAEFYFYITHVNRKRNQKETPGR